MRTSAGLQLTLADRILPYAREKKSQIKLGLDYLASDDKLKKAEIAIQIKALKRVIFYEKNITN